LAYKRTKEKNHNRGKIKMSLLNPVDQHLKQKMPLLFVGHGSPMHTIGLLSLMNGLKKNL
jgi:hypothetical protein